MTFNQICFSLVTVVIATVGALALLAVVIGVVEIDSPVVTIHYMHDASR